MTAPATAAPSEPPMVRSTWLNDTADPSSCAATPRAIRPGIAAKVVPMPMPTRNMPDEQLGQGVVPDDEQQVGQGDEQRAERQHAR